MQAVRPLPGGGALKLTVASFTLAGDGAVDGRGIRPAVVAPDSPASRGTRRCWPRWRRCARRERGRGAGRRRWSCELGRRGRLLVAEPFFELGPPVTLGRRGAGDAGAGDLVAVETDGRGRGRSWSVLGRPDDVRRVLRGLALEEGVRRSRGREAVEDELARWPAVPARGAPTCATALASRSTRRRPRTTTTRWASSPRRTASACSCTSPTSRHFVPGGRRDRRRGRPARDLRLPAGPGRADAAASGSRPTSAACGRTPTATRSPSRSARTARCARTAA